MIPLLRSLCLALLLLFGACADAPKPPPQQPVVTDTRPLGEGLEVIGFAMLGAAVVITLGRLIR